MTIGIYYVFIVSILLVPRLSLQQLRCNSTSDLGQTVCVSIPSYYASQWATCLTEDYIIRASAGRHICFTETATQCWYQCMVEIYSADDGPVYNECGCTPGDVLPNDLRRLEAECYSPRGDDCEWYENCLERRYPCRGTGEGYAIEFAQKFCNLYSDNYNDFTTLGRQWVDAVRQCLQRELVPSLRLWATPTCEEIREEAFNSHPGCYTDLVTPSMCQLGCKDVLKAFAVVNFPGGGLTGALYDAPCDTIDQMLSVMRRCYSNEELSGCISNSLTTIAITLAVRFLSFGNPLLRFAASTTYLVTLHFARTLDWAGNGIGWFPLCNNDVDLEDRSKRQNGDEESQEIIVRILLMDTKLLNISNGTMSQPTSGQTLDQAIDELVAAVMNGSLSMIPLNINNTEVISSLSTVSQCVDIGCNSTANITELVTAPSIAPVTSSTESITPTEPVTTRTGTVAAPVTSSTESIIPTKSVTTRTGTVTAPITTPTPQTKPPDNGGGSETLCLHHLAFYTAFGAILLMIQF